jgi:membrane-associated phospholipid phosphatase
MAFALLAGTLTIEHRRRRQWATAAATAYGGLMIAARVVAGAHWMSDALIAALLTYLIISLLLYLPDREARTALVTAESVPRSAA